MNAIYCSPEMIRSWFNEDAGLSPLPISNFAVPCPWETATISAKEVTLYPFNRRSLFALYEGLAVKTPRMFLIDVIRRQLKEYFNGKKYDSEWAFPQRSAFTGNLHMQNAPHSSAIDRIEILSPDDKQRLKSVLALWGDGSANGIKRVDGMIYFGGINRAFLDDIGLSAFHGIAQLKYEERENGDAGVPPPPIRKPTPEPPIQNLPLDRAAQRRQRDLIIRRNDIDEWYSLGAELRYHPDYRDWLRDFVCGSGSNSGAINWQDIGIPAYIAHERLSDKSVIYIEGQSDTTSSNKTIIVIEKSAESRDALRALCELHYAGGWVFEGAAFYQQKLITWLERGKPTISAKVCAVSDYRECLPVPEWCLALQYLKSLIMGREVDTSSPLSAVKSLSVPLQQDLRINRETKEWNDVISFVSNEEAAFTSAFELLKKSSNTTMGVISGAKSTKSPVYRTEELITAAKKLIACGWDIESELPEISDGNLLFNVAALLKKLYTKVKVLVAAEQKYVASTKEKLVEQVGELTKDNLLNLLSAIQGLFATFNQNGVLGYNELRLRYDTPPIEKSENILKILTKLDTVDTTAPIACLVIYARNETKRLADFLRDLQEIERLAQQEQRNAEQEMRSLTGDIQTDAITDNAIEVLKALCVRLETMEVQNVD